MHAVSAGDPKVVGFSSEVDVTVVHKELDCRELKYRCKIIDGTDSTNYTYSHPVVVKIETGVWWLGMGTGHHLKLHTWFTSLWWTTSCLTCDEPYDTLGVCF